MLRAFVNLAVLYGVFYSLEFASKANINQGVIASLFSSSIVFTAIIFYFLYDERLTWRVLIGIIFIGGGAALISIGKERP